jgi:cellulose synthase/poly-beta-1,6-N-acetylglucosamine synthase-like glycosyltransferase
MLSVAGVIFWLSLIGLLYVYAGYPVCAALLAKQFRRTVRRQSGYQPSVTILIAAYNEEDCIASTLENKLALEYPGEKLEIIVVSDESGDRTDAIVNSFADKRVRLLRQVPRSGKTSALNLAVPLAQGDILVFSDANSMYAEDALQRLVENFADPAVGYVTGKMIYTDPDGTPIGDGCSAYMRYENRLRKIETDLGSIVGVDGGIDAMRKDLYSPLNPDQLPDFVQPLKVVEKGFRVVYEPLALLKEHTLKETGDEYRMRVRVTLRAMWALKDMRQLLFGRGGWLFSWQLWSHKVLRYCCFIFLLAALAANVQLAADSGLYRFFLVLHLACYISAALSPLLERMHRDVAVVRLCYYFLLLNIASLHAAVKFLQGKKQVIWSPRKG